MGQLQHILDDHHRIGADGILVGHHLEGGGDVALHDGVEQIEYAGAVGQAQHVADLLFRDGSGAMGDGLVQQRQAVTHGAIGGATDQRHGRGLDLGVFFFGDGREMLLQHLHLDAAQVETLAAGQDGDGDLADFRGGEDELHMLGRFLQRLQQGIEGSGGQHVHFVDDIDFEAGRGRAIAHAVDDLADVVDAGAAGGIHLHNVHMAVFGDGAAMVADAARLSRRPAGAVGADAVQGAGDDAGGGGLADAAHAGQHEGMSQSAGLDGVGQGADKGFLSDQAGKVGRAVFAGQNPIGSGSWRFGHVAHKKKER